MKANIVTTVRHLIFSPQPALTGPTLLNKTLPPPGDRQSAFCRGKG